MNNINYPTQSITLEHLTEYAKNMIGDELAVEDAETFQKTFNTSMLSATEEQKSEIYKLNKTLYDKFVEDWNNIMDNSDKLMEDGIYKSYPWGDFNQHSSGKSFGFVWEADVMVDYFDKMCNILNVNTDYETLEIGYYEKVETAIEIANSFISDRDFNPFDYEDIVTFTVFE